jgi:hypothetical protein
VIGATPLVLPTIDDLRTRPSLPSLATLAAAISLAHQAVCADSPADDDPLEPRRLARDLLVDHLAGLATAVDRYRAILTLDAADPF